MKSPICSISFAFAIYFLKKMYYNMYRRKNNLAKRRFSMKKNNLRRERERRRFLDFFTVSAPIVAALFLFLASAFYIIYRMVSDYNYNERWKDYDECGLG